MSRGPTEHLSQISSTCVLDRNPGQRYDHAMSDVIQPQRSRLGPPHMIVLALWGLMTAWLLVSMINSVVSAVFYGDGPVNQPVEQVQEDDGASSAGSPRPTP